MATETVTSDATRMMRTVAARRGGGPVINSDVHPSLFTFLQFKHSLRNRRAKDDGSPPKDSECGRCFWRKKMMIIRTQTTTDMVPGGEAEGERRMEEEESSAPVGEKAGREKGDGPSSALAWTSLDFLFRGISREVFPVRTTGTDLIEVHAKGPTRWKVVSSGCPLRWGDSRRSVGDDENPPAPMRTCGKSTAMGGQNSIFCLRGRSVEGEPLSRTAKDKSRGATETLPYPSVAKKFNKIVVHRNDDNTGSNARSWRRLRCHRGMHRSACLFLSILALLLNPALATLSVSISPPLSSSPSSRTLYSSSPSSRSDPSSSSSPRPSSSLSVLPTPWPSLRGTPATAAGTPPPPWEDDPCGDGGVEAAAAAFDRDGISSSVGGGDSPGGASPWLRAEVTHETFEVNALVPGLVYGATLEWSPGLEMRRLVVTSRVDGAPSGTFSGGAGGGRRGRPSSPGIVSCTGGATVGSEALRGRSSYALNWTLPAAGSEVTLRINYLPLAWESVLTESAVATSASDLSMGVVTQSLRLLSVCDLTLSKLWGTLSWGDIEPAFSALGGGDCTVHFSTPPPPPPSSGLQPMGLLLDLTRLNVACSLGHLQFGPSARHVYCGKLEEYRTSERQVHLRGGETPFLRVHSRGRGAGVSGTSGKGRKPPNSRPTSLLPIPPHSQRLQVSFALRYRPVESCYNVTLSSRNGSLLIPPPPPSSPLLPPFRQPSDRVRCTLAVHLPHGYKVSLRLRLLGSSAASSSGAGSLEAAEEREEEELSRWRGREEGERRRKERLARTEAGACPTGVLVGAWEEGPWWTKCLTPEVGVVTETSEGNRVILRVYWGGEKKKQEEDNDLSSEEDLLPSPPSLLIEYAAVEVETTVGGCGFGWVSLGTRGAAEVGRWGQENRRKRRVESGVGGGRGGYQGRRSTCVGAVEVDPLPWEAAEAECVRLGGHLASVRSEEEQAILDTLLTRSPGYSEHNSYWVGASDVVREGDFRWTDGAEFSYSNWFPGWASHGHYNRQPNDDGLSGQDCVELRRAYQLPSAPPPPPSAHRSRLTKVSPRPRPAWPAPILGDVGGGGGGGGGGEDVPSHRLSATHAWNDRDCSAANYYVCEREAPQTPRGGGGGTGEEGGGRRGSGGVGDPSAPGPDDEAGMEGAAGGGGRSGGTREGSPGRSPGGGGRHRDCNREIRLGGAAEEGGASPSEGGRRGGKVGGGGGGGMAGEEEGEGGLRGSAVLMVGAAASTTIVTSPNFPAPYPDDVRCDTVVIAPPGYRLLLEFEELVLEDEPTCSYDYLEILDLGPKGHQDSPEEDGSSFSEDGAPSGGEEEEDREDIGGERRRLESEEEGEGGRGGGGAASGVGSGRRLCGDWSSRLKLLRHVTSGRSLRLRFVSDYSHRFGGFRARVSMLSAATIECADNRLQTFNNSCYLFVGYPEVTWNTAQQICHGMKAELASVLSPSEYRFVTSSIRGSDQYSNSAVYWLGGKLDEQRSTRGKEGREKERGRSDEEGSVGKGGEEGAEGWVGENAAGWHWVDGSLMDFQAWLPETPAGAFGDGSPPPPPPPLCLGVRWRQSPSPRLHPSGLHWSAEKCSTVGGYVCKRRKGWMGLEPAAKESPPTAMDLSGEAEGKVPHVAGTGINFPGDSDQPAVSLASHPSPPSLHPTPRGGQEPWSPPLIMRDRVLKGESGVVTSPGFPDGYPPDVRALVRIVGPPKARLFLRFTALDLEDQPDCLYDYVEIREVREGGGTPTRAERWCGSHTTDLERFDFVSDTNAAEVFFRSDYSVSGAGFSAMWHAVDVSGCPSQTLAASSAAAGETTGVLTSPNHPTALMPRLDCTTTLLAPAGRHVWLEFSESEVVEGGAVELWLGATGRRPFRPFATVRTSEPSSPDTAPPISPPPSTALRHLGDGVFLSAGNRMIVRLWTGDKPRGKGFKASFRAVDNANSEEHVILLANNTHGPLLHLNYPDEPPLNIHFVQRLLAPLGHVVRIRLQDVAVSSSEGSNNATPPLQANGTTTEAPPMATSGTMPSCESPPHLEVRDRYADTGGGSSWILCHSSGSVLSLTSYLNSLTVVQRAVPANLVIKDTPKLNAMVRVIVDPNYKMKLLRISEYEMRGKGSASGNGVLVPGADENKARGLESCHPNPCLHGGKCVGGGPGMLGRRTCQCKGHYTGLFCALTMCDLEPCVFGDCILSGEGETGGPGFTCRCFSGYMGTTCDERPRPCADNPCEGRGDCMEKGPHSFVCRCHAWWEGTRCERRMLRIPYKPLSERMLHEPFWLGLITVTVVLGIIGLIWCAKRHFPEKLEKLLAEEADRSRHGVSASSSARDNLQSLGGPQPYGVAVEGSHHHHHHYQAHPGGQQPPCPPRSLFGRLGIRKPSLLSLTGGGGTSAQMQRPQLAQPTQSPPCPNTPAIPDRKPNAPSLPIPPPTSHHGSRNGTQQHHLPSTSSSASSSAARTFSLDDLLKLPPRRSPSSRKKRNNSSPTRKHSATPSGAAAAAAAVMAEAEKKKILQSLVTPAHKPILTTAARLSISLNSPSETLALGECPPNSQDNSTNVSETKFMGDGGVAGSSGDDVVLEESLPGPPLMPPVPPTASRLDKKVTFARLLSRVSAEMGSSSASGSSSEATPAPKTLQENASPNPDTVQTQHLSSPASDESSSVSSSTSSSSFHAMASSGASPAAPRKSSRTKIQVPVVDALGKDGITSTRGPSILLEPPSSSMCNMDFPPLSPIREMPSPSPSPTRVGGQQLREKGQGGENRSAAAEGGSKGGDDDDDGDTDDMEEEEDEEEPARVCVTQSPEEEGGGDGGGGEGGEEEEEDGEDGEDEEGDEDDDEDDEETEDDEEDDEDEEEQEGKAEEDHIHQKQRSFSLDAAALEATDDDIGDEGLEEDSPTGMETMSETTTTAEKCSLPRLVPPPLSLPPQPIVIPTITIQQPSPTKATMPNTRPQLVLPIGSPPPRRRLSEHHPYPPPIFFQPPLSPQVSQPNNKRLLLHGPDKPTSLDLPMSPPVITVTATMSESDEMEDGCTGGNGRCGNSPYRSSGSGTIGPGGRRIGDDNLKCGGQPGMTYLSPFSMCSRGERTASESNLSSSGYSSMASPGPSRAGSNNPLCPSDGTDAEDPHQHLGGGHPHHGPHLLLPHHRTGPFLHPHHSAAGPTTTLLHPSVQQHHQNYLNLPQGAGGNGQNSPCSDHDAGTPHLSVPSAYSWTRRPSPLLQTPNMEDATVERPPGSPPMAKSIVLRQPQADDGESARVEFNRSSGEEEEEVEGGEVGEGRGWRRRAERRNSSTTPDSNDEGIGTEGENGKAANITQKTLQLPSIVVGVRDSSPPPVELEQAAASRLSPVSSRSESPLSDRVSLPSSSPFGHHSSPRPFSALFFGKGPPLPLTDSDALYDCPSSEVLGGDDSSTGGHTKGLPLGFGLPSHSLTGTVSGKGSNLLEVPHRQGGLQRKISPKRRVRAPVPICSSSSSSSSLEGIHSKRASTSSTFVQQSSRCSSSSDRNASKSIEVPFTAALQSPTKLHHYQPRKYKHLRGWISPGATDQKKCFEATLSPHGLSNITHSSNASSSSTATTPLPHDDVNVTGDAATEIIGKETKWIYGPDKIALHEALMIPLTGQDPLPQTRKICRMKTIGHQIRFLRRLELTLKRRERLVSQSDSDEGPRKVEEDDEHDRKEDSSQSSSETTKVPLLPTALPRGTKESRYRSSFRRQRRAYERVGRGTKTSAPVLEPLLHQLHISTSSEDEEEKPSNRSSPYRQRHINLPPSIANTPTIGVTTVPNINR